MKPECPRCDDTGLKDYAGFGMDLCECQAPKPLADPHGKTAPTLPFHKEAA